MFITTYALILPAITLETQAAREMSGVRTASGSTGSVYVESSSSSGGGSGDSGTSGGSSDSSSSGSSDASASGGSDSSASGGDSSSASSSDTGAAQSSSEGSASSGEGGSDASSSSSDTSSESGDSGESSGASSSDASDASSETGDSGNDTASGDAGDSASSDTESGASDTSDTTDTTDTSDASDTTDTSDTSDASDTTDNADTADDGNNDTSAETDTGDTHTGGGSGGSGGGAASGDSSEKGLIDSMIDELLDMLPIISEDRPYVTADNLRIVAVYEGEDFTAVVRAPQDVSIPEGAELTVTEVEDKSNEYQAYEEVLSDKLDTLGIETFDITTFVCYNVEFTLDGETVIPDGPVNVEIEYTKNTKSHIGEYCFGAVFASEDEEQDVRFVDRSIQNEWDVPAVTQTEKTGVITGLYIDDYEMTGDIPNVIALVAAELSDDDAAVIHELSESERAHHGKIRDTSEDEEPSTEDNDVPVISDDKKATYDIHTVEGDDFIITARVPKDAGIPADAQLEVADLDDSEYADYFKRTKKALGGARINAARYFDISFVVTDEETGRHEAVTPTVPVEITVEISVSESYDIVKVISFADKNGELTNASASGDSVTFSADEPAVYGVLYIPEPKRTVRYEISRGEKAELSDIFEAIGIEAEAEDVLSVVSGDPTIITVKEHKPVLGFIGSHRWTIKCVSSFDEPVSLTVTLSNGSVYDILLVDGGRATYTLEAAGETYKITMVYDDAAQIPEGSVLTAREISPESDEYAEYAGKTSDTLGSNVGSDIEARFFDITIMYEDKEVQPAAPVDIKIELTDVTNVLDSQVVHFGEEDSVLQSSIEESGEGSLVAFETDGFSVFGVTYTVDFHWEVDGKSFEFGIPGGGAVRFSDLLSALSIVYDDEDTAADEVADFVNGIESIRFSDPELICVVKADADTTVGELTDANGLEITYSEELTEEQINEIRAQTVKAGDWALITLKPFISEETLTVTMKNGDSFTINVTDSQIKKTVITASGEKYEITVTYGPDAEIPEGADLSVREIENDSDEFTEYLSGAAERLSADSEDISYARFFDIKIVTEEEENIEPKAPVQVSIILKEAPKQAAAGLQVVHFGAEGAEILSSKLYEEAKADAIEMRFETDEFSVYATITAPAPTDMTDLDGRTFTISRDGRYATSTITDINTGTADGLGKTTSAAQATVWQFEQVDGATYRIFTMESGTKQYLKLTKSTGDVNRANVSLVTGESNASVFTVSQDGNAYRFSTQSDGTTYYLDEHNGNSGDAFAGWHGATDNGRLTLNFTQPIMENGKDYMTLVKYNGKYYIVNNDATLTEVEYNEATQEVRVEDPMEWHVEHIGSDSHIYHHSKETGFTDQQIASDYFRMYLDPSEAGALNEEDSTNVTVTIDRTHTANGVTWDETHIADPSGRQTMLNQTEIDILQVSGKETYTISHGDNYLGLEFDGDGVPVRLAGNKAEGEAAEFVFAKAHVNEANHLTNSVNHIDISIAGTASVSVPLAYGKYYGPEGDAGDPIKEVSSNTKLLLTEDQMPDLSQLRITTDDIKRATITATSLSTGEEIDNAFFITGYSGNVTTAYSGDQVRIEGSFLVADLRGTEYETIDGARYDGTWYSQPDGNYVNAVRSARLNNKVEYTVTVIKPLTYNLVDPVVGQLYDETGKPIQVTVDVAFSASFNYWDDETASNGGNECPPLQDNYAWTQGDIPSHDMSGMDFALGGDAEDPDSPLVALEITKVIMDDNGNRIELKEPIYNYFDIYENKAATNDEKNSPQGVRVIDDTHTQWQGTDADESTWLTDSDYKLWKTKRLKVDTSGSALVYDFNATDAMYYIVEKHDDESLPQVITDKDENLWYYEKTYIETEYSRRDADPFAFDEYSNKALHNHAMHISEEFSQESDSYASIPEVAGNFIMLNGESKKEGFLEFYVYNIYTKKKGHVSFVKTDADGHGLPGATFTLFKSYKNGVLSDPLRTTHIVEETSAINTGLVEFNDIPVGTYYMKETAAPAGYTSSETVYKVVIEDEEDGTKTSKITYLNGTPLVDNKIVNDAGGPGSVSFRKTDSGNTALQGVKFTMYRLSTCESGTELTNTSGIVTATSDPGGNVTFSGIPTGNFYMKETEVPSSSGFDVSSKKYFVHVAEDGNTSGDTSFIAELESRPALNGQTEEEYYRSKAIGTVINYSSDEIIIRKQWRDFHGNSITPDVPYIDLTLKRIAQSGAASPKTINVTVRTNVTSYPAEIHQTFTNVTADSVRIYWNDDGQFDWNAGRLPAPVVSGLTFTDGISEHGHGDTQKDAIWIVSGFNSLSQNTVNITFTYQVNGDQYCSGSYFQGVINGSNISMTPLGEGGGTGSAEQTVGTIRLSADGNWTASRHIFGNTDDPANNTYAARDGSENPYLYFIEESSVPEGYTVSYSASNTGIQSGTLTAINKKGQADITILKLDGSDMTTPLGNALFELLAIDGDSAGVEPLVPQYRRTGYTEPSGVAVFQNVDPGYYRISELEPPAGYLPNEDAVFYVKVTDTDVIRIEKNDSAPPSRWATAQDDETVTFSAGTATVYNFTPKKATLEILKVNEEDRTEPLEGAKFKLIKLDPDGRGSYLSGDDYFEKPSGFTNSSGVTSITDITDGFYEIVETNFPDGYLNTGDEKFYIKVLEGEITRIAKVTDDDPSTDHDDTLVRYWPDMTDNTGRIKFESAAAAPADDPTGQAVATYSVGNTPGAELPSSGGIGTGLFFALGAALMTGAAALYTVRSQRKLRRRRTRR